MCLRYLKENGPEQARRVQVMLDETRTQLFTLQHIYQIKFPNLKCVLLKFHGLLTRNIKHCALTSARMLRQNFRRLPRAVVADHRERATKSPGAVLNTGIYRPWPNRVGGQKPSFTLCATSRASRSQPEDKLNEFRIDKLLAVCHAAD
jgi:hypothetical protein